MANENEYTDRTVELTDRQNEKSEVAFFSNAGGHDVLVSYNYMLRVEGMYDLPCKAVHSFTKENEFDYVQEGGLNDYVHMLRKPISKPFTFTVERYVGTDLIPVLPLGAELVLPVILMVSPFPNDFGKSKRTFVFTGCTVMSKTFGELNAEKSGLLTETIVIGYREMTEVTIPVHAGSDGPVWEFDGRKRDGNNQLNAIRTAEVEGNKPDLRQWGFSQESYKGTGTQSAKKPLTEDVSATDQVADRKWKFDGTGKQSAQKFKETDISKTDGVADRKWKFDGSGKASAQQLTEADLPKKTESEAAEGGESSEVVASVERKWSITNPKENTRAVTEKAGKAEVRRWSMDGKNGEETSAKTIEDSEAEKRQWSMDSKSGEKTSAKTIEDSEAEKRQWSMDGKSGKTTSAVTEKDSKAKGRKWETHGDNKLGGGKASAVTEKDTKAEKRKWPEVSSAKMREENKKETNGRKWPAVSSAKKRQ